MKRRTFLHAAGAAAPAVELLGITAAPDPAPGKFTAINLDRYWNASARDFGPRPAARSINPPSIQDNLIRALSGERQIRGIPFRLGPEGVDRRGWIALSTRSQPWSSRTVEIPIGRSAGYFCLAQFCDWDPADFDPGDVDVIEKLGQPLGEAALIYEDGSERSYPIRRRFEVNPPAAPWGRECFNAMQSNTWRTVKPDDSLARATDWGNHQCGVLYQSLSRTVLWIWALENPSPERAVKTLRLRAAGEDCLVLCGLTLYHGRENPLRHERRTLYRFTLPSPAAEEPDRWKVSVDLGIVCRTFSANEFQPEEWLTSDTAGLGDRARRREGLRHLYAEIASSSEATLTLRDTRGGVDYAFDLARLEPGRELPARQGGSRVEVLEREKTWLHARVIDESTGRPAPVRIAFRSGQGRYLPPYGHRSEVNAAWFQDYGADAQVGEAPFAYVDGTFQIELPAGDVYVELSKGFEYQAVRQRVLIAPGQRELELRIPRLADWRRKGWVTADTHVHFLSPSTALLEAQAEGLNLVNLLAAQWGDLFTNVGDLPHGPLMSSDRETLVSVGTENRQHLLGHLGLLGGHGEPVFPMSADGPSEAYVGDPVWTSMSDWADACRRREGLVVAVHFPNPNAEMAAEIVLGKVDAVELYPRFDATFRALAYHDWYRYLNCGYRVAAAGGTDKMAASTPVGGNRTYAYLAGREFSFANWAAAVRAGRTFATTGPLLEFRADGRMPGDEIRLGAGGGTVEVSVEATSFAPFHRLEVVLNGRVVASREEAGGTRQMSLAEKVAVQGPGWLAARCGSRVASARFGVAAHTSPVYVVVPGRELFSPPAAAYFLKLIEGTQTYVERLATRPDPKRLERIAAVLKDAHSRLHARLEKHG
ncbi:MAG: CehA/McbA family metallohydrolase [Bryobacterales bacterium]|nr:CehA/McbA family metallohydrolase [Bryobacterales bacterium]